MRIPATQHIPFRILILWRFPNLTVGVVPVKQYNRRFLNNPRVPAISQE